jgi:hypothetical protein
MGAVRQALRRAKAPSEVQDAFVKEATSGDYNHLLATAMAYVDVE